MEWEWMKNFLVFAFARTRHTAKAGKRQHVTHNDLVFPEAGHELLEHMAVVAQLLGEGYSPTAQRAFDHRPTPPLPLERDNLREEQVRVCLSSTLITNFRSTRFSFSF
jgi:hypothetical protein